MADKRLVKKVVRSSRRVEVPNERSRTDSRDSGDRNERQGSDEKPAFVNITKLFETKKNPDNLVGTCKLEFLDDIENLIAEAKDKQLGVTFFVFLQGKWGPSLAATLARPQEDRGSFNDGDRGNRGSGGRSSRGGSYQRSGRW